MDKTLVIEPLGGERISIGLSAGNTDKRSRDEFKVATNCCGAHRKQKYHCEMCQKDVTGEKAVNKLVKVSKGKEKPVPVELLSRIDEQLEAMNSDITLARQVAPPSDVADWYDKVFYGAPADGKTGFQDYAKAARLLKGRWFEGSVIYHKNGFRVLATSDGVVIRVWLLVDSAQRKPADIDALSGIVAKAKVDEEELSLMKEILDKAEPAPFNPDDGFRDARIEAQEQLIEQIVCGNAPVPTAVERVVEEKRSEKLAKLRALAGA